MPFVVTDCLQLLQTSRCGRANVAAGNRSFARVWRLIFEALEGAAEIAASELCWMPAHKSIGAVGIALKSDGTAVTFTEWRANRLVDCLAKTAAAFDRVPPAALRKVRAAGLAVEP